jgi:AraC-like DNA-binding protein
MQDTLRHIRAIGALTLSQVEGATAHVERTTPAEEEKGKGSFRLAIQRRGSCVIRQSDRHAMLMPGDALIYLSTLPYELEFHGPFRQTVVGIPMRTMHALCPEIDTLSGITLDGMHPQVALLAMMADCYFDTDFAQLPGRAAPHAASALLDTLAGCLLAHLGALEAKRSNISQYHIDRIQQFALSRLGDNELSIAHVVAALDISAAHIHRLFAGEAQTFSAWLWETRLQLCHLALSNPSLAQLSISQIAFKFGFGHAAHFSRVYRARYGMAPSAWRNRLRQRGTPAVASSRTTTTMPGAGPAQGPAQGPGPRPGQAWQSPPVIAPA